MTSRAHNPDTPADVAIREALRQKRCFVMTSGAGSGKTTSLVKAMAFVARNERNALLQSSRQIACITYTEIARDELFRDLAGDPLCHVSTIHSFLWQLARPFQKDIRRWVGKRNEERLAELRARQAGFGSRVTAKTREATRVEIEECEQLAAVIPMVPRFTYETGRDYRQGILGHDDIIRMVPALLTVHPLFRLVLAQKYPYFFFDESQDTDEGVVKAFQEVATDPAVIAQGFCLGFFGDPMQKIYTAGRGTINPLLGWQPITKVENFRCARQVLATINRIRAGGDNLAQVPGVRRRNEEIVPTPEGYSCLIIMPTTADREESLARVRAFLAQRRQDPLWGSNEAASDVRILVIEHAMAASRLGFEKLFATFNRTDDSIKAAFREGKHWSLRPFTDYLLPLVEAARAARGYDVIDLLRRRGAPAIDRLRAGQNGDPSATLAELKISVAGLVALLAAESTATIQDVLAYAHDKHLLRLDSRLLRILRLPEIPSDAAPSADLAAEEPILPPTPEAVMIEYLSLPAGQLWGYRNYIENRSPYATQQGIKGAEFKRVVVVIDDTESNHFLFSYEKLFGIAPPSERDRQNEAEGKETVIERTRRLFYVCCSRALQDLAVVCYVESPAVLRDRLRDSEIFVGEQIFLSNDLPASTSHQADVVRRG